MANDEKQSSSNMLYVRAIGITGICESPADKYVESAYPITDYHVARTYEGIENFLRENGRIIVPPNRDILPFIRRINLLGLEAEAVYLFDDCLVKNVFEPFGSYSHTGVNHYLIATSFEEDRLKKSLDELKSTGYSHMCSGHWSDNLRFHKQVQVSSADLLTVLRDNPDLLKAIHP